MHVYAFVWRLLLIINRTLTRILSETLLVMPQRVWVSALQSLVNPLHHEHLHNHVHALVLLFVFILVSGCI